MKKKVSLILGIAIVTLICFFAFGRIYNKEKSCDEIVITQYSDVTDNVSMFYTITQNDTFIIIDGGWHDNAQTVRDEIKKHGNHIDAWILTHPHPDHIGAFNEIYKDIGDIKIDKIYATDIDYDIYEKYAKEWDDFSIFKEFYEMSRNMDNLTYLNKGDLLYIKDLRIDICNSYFKGIEKYSKDICNSSSLAFKITGKNQSVFFCGDMYGEAMCNMVIENYRDIISNCTYLQMGHHGNNSCTKEFIDIVNPQSAFFDAPLWLIEGEKYDTKENMEYLQKKDINIYTHVSAPNSIQLY